MLPLTAQYSWLQTSGIITISITISPTAGAECLVCPQHQLG